MTALANKTALKLKPWFRAREVMRQCPSFSYKQAQNALQHCCWDVDKAVSCLDSQYGSESPVLANLDTGGSQEIDVDMFFIGSDDSSLIGVDEASTISEADNLKQDASLSWIRGLPRFLPYTLPLVAGVGGSDFNLRKVIRAIQSGAPAEQIQEYLAFYDNYYREKLEASINENIEGFPAIFYVVEMNDTELLRQWIRYGGDPNATYGPSDFPLLAFAILRGRQTRIKEVETLVTLLSFGASQDVIPSAYYCPYNRDLPMSGPGIEELYDLEDGEKLWCKPSIQPLLASALSLTQRYRLYQASQFWPSTGREQILAKRKGAGQFLELHLHLIGQEMAISLLKRELKIHLAMSRRKPLVLWFAGPSGHGKMELARKLGELMSLDLLSVDCATFTCEDELFGPKPGHDGHEKGGPLNNFLAKKSGSKCIVFMDEFNYTTKDVRKALLTPFEKGEYLDRRNSVKVDCSETIWILTTNKFDGTIHEFCKTNRKPHCNNVTGSQQSSLMRQLGVRLQGECVMHFGASLARNITRIIPFFTFSPDEAALVADKCIMELEAKLAQPVKLALTKQGDNLVGNVKLNITKGCAVCSKFADDYYIPELGARSIFGGVDKVITGPLVDQYLEDGDNFAEDQEETRFTVGVDGEKEVQVWLEPLEYCV